MEDFEYINKKLGTNYKSNQEIDWYDVSYNKVLTESFIDKFHNKVSWGVISISQVLSEPFIEKYKNKINWTSISYSQNLSERFIKKYINKLDQFYISKCQKLSEDFIKDNFNNLNIEEIFISHRLSEQFIENNYNVIFKYPYVKYWMFKYQSLSEGFIERHNGYIITQTLKYQKLSDEFIKKHHLNVDKENLWQYKSERFKKEQLVKTGKYECYEDYFIAYKAVREDRYSFYNFQCQYLPGKTYERHCDCTCNQDSFGLNVGTYDCANSFLKNRKELINRKGLVIKCKVYYKDIGRIVHKGHKVRCFKLTVLE